MYKFVTAVIGVASLLSLSASIYFARVGNGDSGFSSGFGILTVVLTLINCVFTYNAQKDL